MSAWGISWYREKVSEAEKAYMDYRNDELAKGRTYADVEADPVWLKLRMNEMSYRIFYLQHNAERDAYLNRSGSEKRLGKLYGQASRTIASLRHQLRALDAQWKVAMRECTCRAWRKAYNEARGDDLDQLRSALAAEEDLTRRLRKMLQEKK